MAADGFEGILAVIGGWNRWQISLLALGMLVAAQLGFQHDIFVVNSAQAGHWCRIPELEQATVNWTEEERKIFSIPKEEIDGRYEFSSCRMYVRNYSAIGDMSFNESMDAFGENQEVTTRKCNEWHYDRSVYTQSTVMEWDLVCDHKALRPTIQATYMLGVLSATFVFAPLADRLGRRIVTLASLSLSLFCTFVAVLAPNYSALVALRFITGMGGMASYVNNYILVLEISEASRRPFITFMYDIGFAVGILYAGLVGLTIRSWHFTFLAGGLTFTPVLLLTMWFLPESPRWLIINGHIDKAVTHLKNGSRANKRPIEDSSHLESLVKEFYRHELEFKESEQTSEMSGIRKVFWGLYSLVRGPELRRRSLCMYFCWLAIACAAFGSTYLAAALPLGSYYVLIIAGAQAIVLRLLILKPVDIFPRRKIFSVCFYLLATFFLIFAFIPEDWPWVSFAFLLLAKLSINVNFTLIYLYTAELFPTEIRSISLSIGSFCARIAAISAPYIVDLLVLYHRSIPAGIFGILAFLAGILSLLLPETRNKTLPETVEEVEHKRAAKIRRGTKELSDLRRRGTDDEKAQEASKLNENQ